MKQRCYACKLCFHNNITKDIIVRLHCTAFNLVGRVVVADRVMHLAHADNV